MTTALQQYGAEGKATKWAVIYVTRGQTGLWTQRSPLRDAATPYLYEKFYAGARFDSLIDGSNVEISNKLTWRRRPGTSVYNSNTFSGVTAFYDFHQFVGRTETIKVMVDTPTDVYDGTGPSTKTSIFSKSAGSGQTYFQGVGNYLFMGNGVDQTKWDGTTQTKWGIAAPVTAPTVTISSTKGWSASTAYAVTVSIYDDAGNIQFVTSSGTSGSTYPLWATTLGAATTDGSVVWQNAGIPKSWVPNGAAIYTSPTTYDFQGAIIDSAGNIQILTAVIAPGVGGASTPSWSSTPGVTTTDGNLTWTCYSKATLSVQTGYSYVFGLHTTSGNVSTVSPPSQNTGSVVGTYSAVIGQNGTAQGDCDYIYIFRTVDGGSTYFFLAQVANPGAGAWSYTDTSPDSALNELIQAPINHANDPPPTGLIALTYHLNRIWGSVGNIVYYTRIADAQAGNVLEDFPPENSFAFPSLVVRLFPCSIGLLVFTLSDVYLIEGQGTSNSPLFSAPYAHGYGLLSYNCFAVNGSIIYMMTSDGQTLAFDPSAGISEIGFPIGDLLENFSPLNSYVTYHSAGSRDKALYVADGSTGWYRFNQTSAPETGFMWAPKATLACGVVQSLETFPGVHTLLISSKPPLGIIQGCSAGSVAIPGGTLPTGSYYLKITKTTAAGENFISPELGPYAAILGVKDITTIIPASSNTDAITWRVYFGTSSNGENHYIQDTQANVLSNGGILIDVPGTAGTPPTAAAGVILKRDLAVNQDNGVSFTAYATVGSIVLASPGQLAQLGFITVDSVATGTAPAVSVLIGEISGSFQSLATAVNDPPQLAASSTIIGKRYYFQQNVGSAAPGPCVCRHLQIKFSWPAENFANELLAYAIFGAHWQEEC